MKSTNDKIDEILDYTDWNVAKQVHKDVMDTPDNEVIVEMRIKLEQGIKSQLKDQLYQLLLEVIGEDEEDDLNPFSMMARSTSQNWLRQEYRQKLSDLFNIKDK